MCETFRFAFRSGMSAKSDLRGAIEAKVPLGVVAGLLTTAAMVLVIPRYLDEGGAVFVDSGAFAEKDSGIEPNWRDILFRYDTLANLADRHDRLYLVAPDKVGDQAESIRRLTRYRDRVIALAKQGCQIIVPIQRGELPANEMLNVVRDILGGTPFIAGIPSNKDALPIEECAAMRHHAFHILGRVEMNDDQAARIAALRMLSPAATITADATWLRGTRRMKKVTQGTEAIAADRRKDRSAGNMPFTLDHPRALSVENALREDLSWGNFKINGESRGTFAHPH